MISSDVALDRVCDLVAGWMQDRRQSASDTLGDIADLLETTGRRVETGRQSPAGLIRGHLRLVSDNRPFS